MRVPLDDPPQSLVKKCLCGNVAWRTCGELWPPVTLTLCNAPLCGTACKVHRHEAGTMGYPGTLGGVTKYEGDEPNGDGAWEWVKSRYRALFWSDLKKAQSTYDEICANFAPPAPWPYVQLQIGRKTFESDGPRGMKRLTSIPLRRKSFP